MVALARTAAGLLIAARLDEAGGDQSLQARTEQVGGDAECRAQVAEPVSAAEQLPDDQERPAFADHLQGAFDRADRFVRQHESNCSHLVILLQFSWFTHANMLKLKEIRISRYFRQ